MLLLFQSASAETRENFTLGGLPAYLITPDTPAPGKPWIAFTPSLPGPTSGETWMFAQYYAAGIAVAGIDSGDGFGSPTQRTAFTNLYNELVNNRGYADKVSFHTRSRGGLLGLNWSAENPQKVAVIGGIYPAHNLLSFPGASAAAGTYGVTVSELTTNIHLYNPIERLAPLAAAGVKIFSLHGDSDGVVPLSQNSQITKARYDILGGDMTLKVIVGGGHDLNSHWFQDQELTDFMIDETLAAADTVGPPTLNLLTSVTPADDAIDVTVSSNLVANFSEAIALTGSGTINLKNLSGGADIPVALPGDVTIAGRKLTLNPASNLVGDETYAVEISSDAIKDLDDTPNPFAGLLSTDTPNWSFTADGTAPTIASMAPLTSNISPASDLTLTFDEDVQATSGNITLHLASDDSVVETIAATSGAVTITGSEVVIELATLTANTSYYVNIPLGSFEDPSGNPSTGITNETTWAFTTGDVVGPLAVTNFSFDEDGTITTATPTGWTSVNTNLGTRTGVGGVVPTDGTHQLWLNGGNTIYQNVGILIEAGTTYTLTVDVTTTPPFDGHTGTLRLYGSTLGFGTAIGGAETSKVTAVSVWTTETTSFTATATEAGQTLGIALSTTGTQTEWDNVRLTATIPPPANTFVNWIGGFGLAVADQDFDDDSDGDGLENGLEAWFGTHPGQFSTGIADISNIALTTTFTHPQNDDPPSDLTGYYEWSPNLVDWYASGIGPDGGATVTFSASTSGTTTVTATASKPIDKLFLRAGVMQD